MGVNDVGHVSAGFQVTILDGMNGAFCLIEKKSKVREKYKCKKQKKTAAYMTFSDELNIKPVKPKAGLTLFGRGVDGAGELGVRLGSLGGNHDVGSIPSSLEGDGLPDAPTRARDEDCLSGELPGLRKRLNAFSIMAILPNLTHPVLSMADSLDRQFTAGQSPFGVGRGRADTGRDQCRGMEIWSPQNQ